MATKAKATRAYVIVHEKAGDPVRHLVNVRDGKSIWSADPHDAALFKTGKAASEQARLLAPDYSPVIRRKTEADILAAARAKAEAEGACEVCGARDQHGAECQECGARERLDEGRSER